VSAPHHDIVSRDEWLAAHQQHLAREKAFTRMRDQLSAARRELPWTRVEKPYVFDSPRGRQTFADLFNGRSQLIVKHFMLGPGWQEGCVGCSFEADHIEGALPHLEHHDVSFVAISRAPLAEIETFKRRMGWHFNWVSSHGSDFNYDFHVSFTPEQAATGKVYYNFGMQPFVCEELSGINMFYKDASGEVFHTFSAYGRGAEEILGTYMCLDLTPKGRNETGPNFDLTDWVRHHDRYDAAGFVDSTGRYQPAGAAKPCCD
jgi:predicted dithiol-disulfide oxidoreductase (DUF899 family)